MKITAIALRQRLALLAALLGALLAPPRAAAPPTPASSRSAATTRCSTTRQELAVPASCKEVTLTLHHTGKLPKDAMGHNWVLVKHARSDRGGQRRHGRRARQQLRRSPATSACSRTPRSSAAGRRPASRSRPPALKTGGDYSYLCTFPGHNALMHGTFKFG